MVQLFLKHAVRIALAVTGVTLLSGCAGGSAEQITGGASWPGMTVSEDTVYVAFHGQVYAIDGETHEALWGFPEKADSKQNFYASPAVDGDLVVVADYTDTLFALNKADGETLWMFKSDRSRFIGGAVIGGDSVYAATVDGNVYALNRSDGKSLWKTPLNGNIWSTPLLADGILYITSLDRHVYALEAATGEMQWKFPGEGDDPIGAVPSTPTLYEGVLYFGSFDNRLYALSVETRTILWSYQTTNWVWCPPVIDEANRQLIDADLDGHIFALNLDTHELNWMYEAGAAVVGSPLLGQLEDGTNVVYVTAGAATGNPNLFILKTDDGDEATRPAIVQAEFSTSFLFIPTGTSIRSIPLLAPPLPYKDQVLIGSHEAGTKLVYALNAETQQEEWFFDPKVYEQAKQQEQGQTQQTFWNSPFFNILLILAVVVLMTSMMRRNREQK